MYMIRSTKRIIQVTENFGNLFSLQNLKGSTTFHGLHTINKVASVLDKMTAQVSLPPKTNFYRKPLPETCISFSSNEGKTLFKEALSSGHLACYFKLAAQFRTQDEPAFCGLSTLVMVLNALEIDPGQIWKGPWRWYHENMLDCCTPLQIIEQNGINFNQFMCIASCNNLNVRSTRADDLLDVSSFREVVKTYTEQDEAFVVLSYSRKVLGQTGDGHFSPIGGYHPDRDMILMMDTARFKYPPHWIPLPLLFNSMKSLDEETGQPRGFMILSRQKEGIHLLLFSVSQVLSVTAPDNLPTDVSAFLSSWRMFLKTSIDKSAPFSDEKLVEIIVNNLLNCAKVLEDEHFMLTINTLIDAEQCSNIKHLICELESLQLYSSVRSILSHCDSQIFLKLFNGKNNENIVSSMGIKDTHFLTFFLLCWPYACVVCSTGETTMGGEMTKYANCILATKLDYLKDEIMIIRSQLENILDFNEQKKSHSNCCRKSCSKKIRK
ncbi:hypothetical protein SNE40_018623 [Patella caerulea]|uniref:glutathione gamma-glutamylcysteinyltransferase n=1 Tax=Patella caerulea TaxID=87958 RepID=A0AAN8P888_PATCE